MEAEWVLGIAAGAIAAVSGMTIATKRTKTKIDETKEQTIMDEFIVPFIPEVMSFYHLEVLGKNPLSAIDIEKLVERIYDKSLTEGYGLFDRHESLSHLQRLAIEARSGQKELLGFLFWYLDFANGILQDTSPKPYPLLRESRQLQKQYAVWCFCREELDVDAPRSVEELIHHSDYFEDVLSEIEIGVFRGLMEDDELRNERRGNFVRIIFQAFEKEAEGEVELNAIHQFHEHYNKRYTHRNKGLIRF
ncbi:MAG: hypothetical protein ACQEV0_06630 [Bacillota bacterium]